MTQDSSATPAPVPAPAQPADRDSNPVHWAVDEARNLAGYFTSSGFVKTAVEAGEVALKDIVAAFEQAVAEKIGAPAPAAGEAPAGSAPDAR